MDTKPIFIAGPDRSGTTLMYAFLASHPQISMVRRTNMWRYFYGRYGDLSQRENFEHCLADMVRYKRMGVLRPDPARIAEEFWQGEATYGRLFAIFHQQHARQLGKSRWGDKSLHTEHYAERVFREFPQARIIHMVRDPRDRYASVKKRHGRTVNRVGASVGRWLFSMRVARRNLERYPGQYLIVRYEQLAQQPEETLRQVCAFIEEEYSPLMLTMSGAADYRDSGGNSSFETITPGTISTKPIGRFRQVLSPAEIGFIQTFAGKEMLALGYELEPLRLTLSDRLSLLSMLPYQAARMYGWMTLEAAMIRRGEPIPSHRMKDSENELAEFTQEAA
jgi:hypothetical protein